MDYVCDDGNCPVTITAESAREAAQEYVDNGDWHAETTTWIKVYVTDDDGDRATFKITVEPPEPPCSQKGSEHNWESPFRILGGVKENPGVWGHGGGVRVTEVCMTCGCGKHTDTGAHDPSDGEQGLTSVYYTPGEFENRLSEDE